MTVTFIYGVILAQIPHTQVMTNEQQTLVDGLAERFFPEKWEELRHDLGGSGMGEDNDFWADIGTNGEAVIPGTPYVLQCFVDDAGGAVYALYIGNDPQPQVGRQTEENVIPVPLPSEEQQRDFSEFLLAVVDDDIFERLPIGAFLVQA